jgi:hypothetical protein
MPLCSYVQHAAAGPCCAHRRTCWARRRSPMLGAPPPVSSDGRAQLPASPLRAPAAGIPSACAHRRQPCCARPPPVSYAGRAAAYLLYWVCATGRCTRRRRHSLCARPPLASLLRAPAANLLCWARHRLSPLLGMRRRLMHALSSASPLRAPAVGIPSTCARHWPPLLHAPPAASSARRTIASPCCCAHYRRHPLLCTPTAGFPCFAEARGGRRSCQR